MTWDLALLTLAKLFRINMQCLLSLTLKKFKRVILLYLRVCPFGFKLIKTRWSENMRKNV